jgi:hypothetical protein
MEIEMAWQFFVKFSNIKLNLFLRHFTHVDRQKEHF